jgi:phosphoglycolate phosphatase
LKHKRLFAKTAFFLSRETPAETQRNADINLFTEGEIVMEHTAVLFDLDGTLLDTLEDLAASMNAALEHNGFPQHPVVRYKIFVGAGMNELARRALPAGAADETVRRLTEDMRAEYSRRWATATRPYPGITGMLDVLSGAGIRFSLLSNKSDDFTAMLCSHFLGAWNFEIIRGAIDSVPKKPDPAAALMIARGMGIDPARFVYLGDSGTDMMTAKAAGMYPAGALWGFRGADELTTAGALTLIERPEEIFPLLRMHVMGPGPEDRP